MSTTNSTGSKNLVGWQITLIIIAVLAVVGAAGFAIINLVLDSKPFEKTEIPGIGQDGGPLDPNQNPGDGSGVDGDALIPAEGIFATEFKDSTRINILMIGRTREGLADTIMLASVDPDRNAVDLISVPRDTYYPRAGYSGAWLKMNAVFHEGPAALAAGVHDVLQGIPIHYYAVFDYDGVAKIIDAIGGVPMSIPQKMYYVVPSENLYIDIPAGDQILDGNHSVQYLRFRSGYSNGDIGRVQAQQKFVKSAIKQLLKSNLSDVATLALDNIDSDITVRTVLDLVNIGTNLDSSSTGAYMLPGTSGGIDGLSFWKPTGAAATAEMLRGVYASSPVTTGSAVQ
ncbi:MAG: LCP family protein [Clostridiales Family XIII bacterium]|jgi:LCP family protein required for cell wall assembly|nr:LCP family protein [Clostridiales Family XIII bacterium]